MLILFCRKLFEKLIRFLINYCQIDIKSQSLNLFEIVSEHFWRSPCSSFYNFNVLCKFLYNATYRKLVWHAYFKVSYWSYCRLCQCFLRWPQFLQVLHLTHVCKIIYQIQNLEQVLNYRKWKCRFTLHFTHIFINFSRQKTFLVEVFYYCSALWLHKLFCLNHHLPL